MNLLKSEFKILISYIRKFAAIFIIAALALAIPTTLALLNSQQDIRQRASGPNDIHHLAFNPPYIQMDSVGKPVNLSVMAYDANNNPLYDLPSYEWGISSTNSVGTLTSVKGAIATFVPKNIGYADIYVIASGASIIKASIPVYVGITPAPNTPTPPPNTPTGAATPTSITQPTCTPRPACLDATSGPKCAVVEPAGGFCPPNISPTGTCNGQVTTSFYKGNCADDLYMSVTAGCPDGFNPIASTGQCTTKAKLANLALSACAGHISCTTTPTPTQKREQIFGKYAWTGTCTSGCVGDVAHTMNITTIDDDVFSGTGYYNGDPNGTTWTITGHTRPDNTMTFNMVYTGNNAGYTTTGSGKFDGNGVWSGTLSTSQGQKANWKIVPIKTTKPTVNVAPELNNVVIDTKAVEPGVKYNIVMTSSDANDASDISNQYALINYQGPAAGNYRGFVGWSPAGFSRYWSNTTKGSPINCTLAPGNVAAKPGQAAIYAGYGSEYINLHACTSAQISETVRRTTLTVSFNNNFTFPTSNTLSGFTDDTAGLYSGWTPFGTFGLAQPNQTPSVISGSASYQNGTYILKVSGQDFNGTNDVASIYSFINYQGETGGQYRGYFGWSDTGFPYWGGNYDAKTGLLKCVGGGAGATYNGYGNQYIKLTSCAVATSSDGTTKTATFTFTKNAAFKSPAINTVSGIVIDRAGAYSPWRLLTKFPLK